MYEEYISIELNNDTGNLVRDIIESNELYKDILNKGNITRYEAERLKFNAYTIQKFTQEYGFLARNFERTKSNEFQNETASQVADIAYFYSEMNGETIIDGDNMDEVILMLDEEMEEKIIYLEKLNSLWVTSLKRNVPGVTNDGKEIVFDNLGIHEQYGDKSISNNFWVNLILDMEKNTGNFLADNRWFEINEVLQK